MNPMGLARALNEGEGRPVEPLVVLADTQQLRAHIRGLTSHTEVSEILGPKNRWTEMQVGIALADVLVLDLTFSGTDGGDGMLAGYALGLGKPVILYLARRGDTVRDRINSWVRDACIECDRDEHLRALLSNDPTASVRRFIHTEKK